MRNIVNIFLLLIFISNNTSGQVFFDRYEINIELLPLINSAGSEISPAFVKDEVYFSAVRETSVDKERLQETENSFYDVYFTETNEFGYPVVLPKLVPGFGKMYHEGPVSWCAVTGELFVTLSNLPEEGSFLSGRNRKNVKLRLAIMKEEDEEWTIVEELPFNRKEYNAAHPAISSTGDTLIFSSDMEGGYGQSDLYMAVRKANQWSEPVNLGETINTPGNEMFPSFGPEGLLLFSSDGRTDKVGRLDLYFTSFEKESPVISLGKPVNSEYDDFGLVIHPDHEYGYFTSGRPGTGGDDIYRIELISLFERIGGTVLDEADVPLPEASVLLQDCNGNQLQNSLTGSKGKFSFEVRKDGCYQAIAFKKGYDSDTASYYLGTSVLLNLVQQTSYQIYVTDMEDGEPISEAKINCKQQQWLTDGFGYASINPDSLGVCDLKITGAGYFNYIIDADPYRFTPGDNITDTVRLYKKEPGKSYRLEHIEFFLDKWRLLPQSEQELNRLIKFMKDNPSLKVEIASHTDSRGEVKYNQWLSQKRSDSAKDFLIENGISEDRIVSKGYGESRLINHCADGTPCSEAEHLENRRTEFVILDF